MKRYMLTEPAFIGLALLDAGSIVTDADLPEALELDAEGNETGETYRSKPPRSSIEVDKNGHPVNDRDRRAAASLPAPESTLDTATDTAAADAIAQEADNEKRAVGADAIAAAAKTASQPQRRGTAAETK